MASPSTSASKYWLLKAEPDSRIVKGKDVKFSVEDFERVKTSPWEGVRSYEARNLMKQMSVGDNALFYHSNCKTPGIAAFAEATKEAYPDYTAWDPSHPYYDEKSDSTNPKWFMVDLTFKSRAKNFIPLALLRYIASRTETEPPDKISYIGEAGITALQGMDLVRKGRLSVQRVTQEAWDAISLLAEKGGWDDMDLRPSKPKARAKPAKSDDNEDALPGTDPKPKKNLPKRQKTANSRKAATKKQTEDDAAESSSLSELSDENDPAPQPVKPRKVAAKTTKRKRAGDEGLESPRTEEPDAQPPPTDLRRSTRRRKI